MKKAFIVSLLVLSLIAAPAFAQGFAPSSKVTTPTIETPATPPVKVVKTHLRGPAPVKAGMTQKRARTIITRVRPFYAVKGYHTKYSDTVAKGRVIRVIPTKHTKKYHKKGRHYKVIYTTTNGITKIDKPRFIIVVSKGPKPYKWKTGTATWYDIADNTPAGSRQTASGHPLGSFGGWTFASCNFPMGTVLLIKGPNGKTHKVTMTDTGGYETIDLYKPASDYFGMDGMSSFKYVVLRRGW